jgi:hypothetical protein
MTIVLASDPGPGVPNQSGSATGYNVWLGVSVFCEPGVRGLQGESRHGRPFHHQQGGRARAGSSGQSHRQCCGYVFADEI